MPSITGLLGLQLISAAICSSMDEKFLRDKGPSYTVSLYLVIDKWYPFHSVFNECELIKIQARR